MPVEIKKAPRRRWFSLGARIVRLLFTQTGDTGELVCSSYDHLAPGYDEAWTHHMRDLSLDLLDALGSIEGARCLDLTCGTGFLTGELSRRSGCRAIGVDRSGGMLEVARRNHGEACEFVGAGALSYLRSSPPESLDIVTCGWGLGYTRPWPVLRQVARVLRPGGRAAVIDNSLFSLAGVLWCSTLAFAEEPEALAHVMKVRFLPARWLLGAQMRLCGLRVRRSWKGSRSYHARDGSDAISRLTATGAGAGFEFACTDESRERIFERFARIIEERRGGERGVRITHRFLAAVAEKP